LFEDPEAHVIVLTNSDREPPPCECHLTVERLLGEELDLAAAAGLLRERHGIRAMLLEGGPTLLASMLNAALVDELFLSTSPLLVGGDEPSLLEGSALDRPLKLALLSVLEEENFLYLRYRLN
jgi:riboflavin biosynthesis pyrimidine reductase